MADLPPPSDPWRSMPTGPPPADGAPPPQEPGSVPVGPPAAGPWAPPVAWAPAPAGAWPSPPPDWGGAPADPRRWGIGDIFWGLGVVVLASVLLTIPLVVTGAQTNTVWVTAAGALGTWAGFAGWPLYCSWVKGIGTLRADFGLRMEWYDLLLGIGAAGAALLVNGFLGYLESQLGAEPETNTQILSDARGTGIGVVVVSAIAVLGAPFFEELFFRGLTFGAIEKRFNRWSAFVFSTILFTLLHAQPADTLGGLLLLLVHIGVIGATFGLLRLFTGRLGASIVAHMTVNGIATIVVLAGAFGS